MRGKRLSRRPAERQRRAGDLSGEEVTVNAFRLLAAAAVVSLAAHSPSWAQMKPLGSVHIATASAVPVEFREAFPGRLEWLGFNAPHGDVACNSVRARFADGSEYEVWRGGRVSHGGVTAELPQ